MDWQRIVRDDPYLAGHIAAGSYEWWDPSAPTAEAVASLCGLVPGDSRYNDFMRGWQACLAESHINRLREQWEARLKEGKQYTKEDPEIW